ncbi:MAG TPA: ABC transporter ATP-binding protein, partial [Streptosporangiaceae bacterium]|nr:ABC transporter ATP-binding protein [Streptosporangiaceae bacterium]
SYLFIAHDLALVKQVSDRVAVMYLGRLCEAGPGESVYREPLHPYTRALLDSVPSTDKHSTATKRAPTTISGEPPSPVHPPSGCRFRTRCPRAQEVCAAEQPPMRELATGHPVACHFPLAAEPAGPAAAGGPGSRAAAGGPGSRAAARTTVRSDEKIEGTPR